MCSYSNSDGLEKQPFLFKIVPTNFGIRCRDKGEKRQRNLCVLCKLCRNMRSGLSLCCLGKLLHKALLLSFPKHLKILCVYLHYKRTINSICFQLFRVGLSRSNSPSCKQPHTVVSEVTTLVIIIQCVYKELFLWTDKDDIPVISAKTVKGKRRVG